MPIHRASQEPDSARVTNDMELNAGTTFNDVATTIYNNTQGKLNDVASAIYNNTQSKLNDVADAARSTFKRIMVSWKYTDSPDFKHNPEASNNLYEWWNNSEYTTSRTGKPLKNKLAKIMKVKNSTAGGYVKDKYEDRKIPTIWAAENLKDFLLKETGSHETYYDIINGRGAYSIAKDRERKKPYIDSIQALTSEEILLQLDEPCLKAIQEGLRGFLSVL